MAKETAWMWEDDGLYYKGQRVGPVGLSNGKICVRTEAYMDIEVEDINSGLALVMKIAHERGLEKEQKNAS